MARRKDGIKWQTNENTQTKPNTTRLCRRSETPTTTEEIPVEEVPDESVIKQADIEHAVDEALSEQAVTYQETIDTLEEKLSQFEQEDIEAYQIQVEDLHKEISIEKNRKYYNSICKVLSSFFFTFFL